MTRSVFSILCLGLLTVVPVSAQQVGGSSGGDAVTLEGTEQGEIFMGAFREILQRHQGAFSDSTLWVRALDGLVEGLDDPYAEVFTPREVEAFEEQNTGNYSGIGVQITELNDRVTVTAVFHRTPADEAGMLLGDVIVGVDQNDATEWTTAMASDSIRGDAGTGVKVTVEREGFSRPIPLHLTRAEVHVPAVRSAVIPDSEIGYLTLDRVARGSAMEVDSVLRGPLSGIEGLVFDLRGNPGGFLEESLIISDLFLDRGDRLASLKSRALGMIDEVEEESWNARSRPRISDVPIVVLVNGYTASAAEIITGALQDHDRALVLGQRTFGKGVVQSVLELPYGHRLRITTGSWHTPLGRSLNRSRDKDGAPLPENPSEFPEVETPGGRTLSAGGGIFPDITIQNDTLTLRERELLLTAAELELPLSLRLAEFGFEQARALEALGEPAQLRDLEFETLLASLEEQGLPTEFLSDAELRDYLAWRANILVADRMDDMGSSVRVRQERDPALAEALRLLQSANTQDDLFAAAAQAVDHPPGVGVDSGGTR